MDKWWPVWDLPVWDLAGLGSAGLESGRMSLITYLTRVHFADRVLEDALSEEMRRLSAIRPLVLVDADGRAGDSLGRLEDALPAGCAPVRFPDLPFVCPAALLQGARRLYIAENCDLILSCGGASAVEFGRLLAGARRGTEAWPLLVVPTTAADIGLGPISAAYFPRSGRTALPNAILCDPTLLMAVEPERTAAHAFDALTHCLEAFLGTAYNPPADGIALEGVRRVALYLERAVADCHDIEARREVLAAALNAGLAAQKGLGGIEALTRAVEAECGLVGRHGLLHASILPQLLAFNAPAVGSRFDRIAEAMNLPRTADVAGALVELGDRVGLPRRIGPLGLSREGLERAAKRAAADPFNQTNPRHATSADYLVLLQGAL